MVYKTNFFFVDNNIGSTDLGFIFGYRPKFIFMYDHHEIYHAVSLLPIINNSQKKNEKIMKGNFYILAYYV